VETDSRGSLNWGKWICFSTCFAAEMLLKECTSQILLQITLFGVFTPSLGVSAVSSKPCVESLLASLSSLHFLPYEHPICFADFALICSLCPSFCDFFGS